MSEVNLHKELERGAAAQAWLDDKTTKEAFAVVRQGILDRWADSPVEDKEGQHTLRLMLKLLDDVYGNVKQVAITGQMAAAQIKQENEMKKRAKQFLNKFGVRV